jgi:hypothetical protein
MVHSNGCWELKPLAPVLKLRWLHQTLLLARNGNFSADRYCEKCTQFLHQKQDADAYPGSYASSPSYLVQVD